MRKSVFIQALLSLVAFLSQAFGADAQTYTLEQCRQSATENYPLIKQRELLDKIGEFSLANAACQWLPQFGVFGQYTYQSEVTALPIKLPGVTVPELSKDQFKLYAELTQTLYDGGNNSLLKQDIVLNREIEKTKNEVDMHLVLERVQSTFFGLLMLQERLQLLSLTRKDLEAGRDRLKASEDAGTALESQVLAMEVELLNLDQRKIETETARRSYLSALGILCGKQIPESAIFLMPADIRLNGSVQRAELSLIELQQRKYDIRYKQLNAMLNPKLSLFVQGGMGRPGLNMLNNEVRAYGIGGLRLSMPLSSVYTLKNDRNLIQAYRENLNVQKEVFNLNNGIRMSQAKIEADAATLMIRNDEAILLMRTKIKNTALAQLEAGTLAPADYIREVNAEESARLNLSLHKLQQLSSVYQYNQLTEK